MTWILFGDGRDRYMWFIGWLLIAGIPIASYWLMQFAYNLGLFVDDEELKFITFRANGLEDRFEIGRINFWADALAHSMIFGVIALAWPVLHLPILFMGTPVFIALCLRYLRRQQKRMKSILDRMDELKEEKKEEKKEEDAQG